MEERSTRKERTGTVTSSVQDKTIVVRVERRTTHPLYGKTMTQSKKYHVHDEVNDANVGDTVRIVETRPISKLKRWRLAEIIERAK
ncbi:MAG: 30S ribosomal protein S17 [Egicoccus sp.]